MPHELAGIATATLVAQHADVLLSERRASVEVTLDGFVGDRHAGRTRLSGSTTPYYPRNTEIQSARQVTIVSEEELERIARVMGIPQVSPEWLGANVLMRGIPDLSHLPPTSTLHFPGGVVLVVYKENNPCSGPAKVIQSLHPDIPGLAAAFPKVAMGLRGLLLWVEHGGVVREGDEVRVQVAHQIIYG